jgi:hypothetical protein
MHPIERLRHVARAGDVDDTALAEEAALALGGLAFDARALVPAARRLLEFHPRCAPLWAVCAEVLTAADPAGRAYELAELLGADPTSDELAAALPGAVTLASTGGRVVCGALAERPDLTVHLLDRPSGLRRQLRRLAECLEAVAFTDGEVAESLDGVHLALVDALALGPSGVLLAPLAGALASAAVAAQVPLWVVVGECRVLPGALFDALAGRCGVGAPLGAPADLAGGDPYDHDPFAAEHDEAADAAVLVAIDAIEVLVGPDGPSLARGGARRASCPAPAELLYGIGER